MSSSDLPIYGIDIELKSKIEGKYDHEAESQVIKFIERFTDPKPENVTFQNWLKNGLPLCRMAQAIRPDLIGNFREDAVKPFQMMENVEAFLKWCTGMGLLAKDLFQTVDLYEAKDMTNVLTSLVVLKTHLERIESRETPAPPLKITPVKKGKDYKPILWNSWLPPKPEHQWDHLQKKNEGLVSTGGSPKSSEPAQPVVKKPAPAFSGILEKRKSNSSIVRAAAEQKAVGASSSDESVAGRTSSASDSPSNSSPSEPAAPVGVDPAFIGCAQKEGLTIWRAENMKIVPVPVQDYGKFYSGDSYIVLNTKKVGKQWDIHFWLGKTTSTDEMGLVAYKTFELDEYLGGGPVQYREVQEHESPQFMSLFKATGLQYLEGGVESGFRHVDRDAFEERLLHIKGSRNVRVNQVPMSVSSLNEGDVFILDLGRKIYQWNGKLASRREKLKGMEIARKIKDDERATVAEFILLDPTEGSTEIPDETEFWEKLGGTRDQVSSADEVASDQSVDQAVDCVLYQVSDASGELEVNEVGRTPLDSSLLDDDDCFILEASTEVFVWIGKKATKQERLESMNLTQEFLVIQNKPNWTPISRVVSGAETTVFKSKFKVWRDKSKLKENQPKQFSYVRTKSALQMAREDSKADIQRVMRSPRREAEQASVPLLDENGRLQVWRVENFELVEQKPDGQFFSGDSYVLLYSYSGNAPNYAKHMIYIWQGVKSSSDERGASVLHARNIQDGLQGTSSQVRVTQNKEPDHFLQLFKGRMIVHEGGCASGFKNRNDSDVYDTDGVSLFHVRGTNELNARAVQVVEETSSLNSNDVFVLLTPPTMFVWFGRGANRHERKCGLGVANILKGTREVVEVEEGKEPEEFWSVLGGKGEYPSEGWMTDESREPRLFQCSNASGKFTIEEIFTYSQEDLDVSDIFILDCYNEVFVWVGYDSNEIEKTLSFELAVKFVEEAQDGRSKETPITLVLSGEEPPIFTCHFLGWDYTVFVPTPHSDRKLQQFADSVTDAIQPESQPEPTPEPTQPELPSAPSDENVESQASETKESEQDGSSTPKKGVPKIPLRTAPPPTTAPLTSSTSGNNDASNEPPRSPRSPRSPKGSRVGGRIDVRQALKAFSDKQVVPYEKLITRPQGCDAALLETYLSDQEFEKVFEMTRAQFEALPAWKKASKKRDKNLF